MPLTLLLYAILLHLQALTKQQFLLALTSYPLSPQKKQMEKSWFLALLILQYLSAETAGVVTIGGGTNQNGGIWFRGGISNQNPFGSSNSRLSNAYTALQAWKSAITEDPLGVLGTWVGPDVCSYKGVFCSEDTEMSSGLFVAAIDLNHASLQGSLVKELSFLSDLSVFHINSNRFSGAVPETFRNLMSLSELDLSNNQFSGPFPSVTLQLPNLIYLDIRFNHFSGYLPDDLFNKNLDAIFLNNNQFEGQIPQNLGNSPASVINLANNRFTGNLPSSFGYMGPRLKEVLFLNNQLTGCIPEGVGFLTDMEVLDLSFNSLGGHLPDTLTCLSEVEVLNLAHNQLSGVIPDLICSLQNLLNLTISYNFFSGISQDCTGYRSFWFDFSGNCIPGKYMQRPPPECSGMPGGLNCMRIPSPRPGMCAGSMDRRQAAYQNSYRPSSP